MDMKAEGDEGKDKDKEPKKKEATSEIKSNLTRVTPSQLSYVSFPKEGRYQPVRPVSSKPSTSSSGKTKVATGAAVGGGILLLVDKRPGEPGNFISLEPTPIPEAAAQQQAAAPAQGRHIALEDGPEVDPPESFEVSSCRTSVFLWVNGADCGF